VAVVLKFHANRAFFLQQDAGGVCTSEDSQVGPLQVGCQVGFGSAAALAVSVGHLVQAHAFLVNTIEIGVALVASLLASLHKQLAKAVGVAQIHDVEWTATAVQRIAATFVVLRAFEVGQHVVIRPAGVAQRRPVVVVGSLAANVDHGVE
jgi:hypothetical protein